MVFRLKDLHTLQMPIEPIFKSIPTSLLFDSHFLEYFMGDRMFPFERPGFITDDEAFPGMMMPRFKSMILMKRKLNCAWYVDIRCTCPHENTLFCLSLNRHVLNIWVDIVKQYMEEVRSADTWPEYTFNDMSALNRPYHDFAPWFLPRMDPLVCCHYFFTDRVVKYSYAVGRRDGKYYVFVMPRFLNRRLKNCLDVLNEVRKELPFEVAIDCYPFYRVEFFKHYGI